MPVTVSSVHEEAVFTSDWDTEPEPSPLAIGLAILRRPRRGARFWAAGLLSVALLAAMLLAAHRGESGVQSAAAADGSEFAVEEEKKRAKRSSASKNDTKQEVSDEAKMGMGWPKDVYWPKLFCWSVMNYENAQEVATIKGQLRNRTGIFGCESVAVLSGKKMLIGHGHDGVEVYTWLNPAHSVPMGNLQGGDHTNSFKNADIFINAWDILVNSGALWGHDWIAKVDPDAVFFADRLRRHMKKWTWGNEAWYFKNCDFKGPQLYGALEVFNNWSMKLYKEKGASCKNLPWGGWGEDEWIDKCMLQLGAHFKIDYKLVGDHRCMAAECGDLERVAFHDYKTEEAYYNCWLKNQDAEKVKSGGYFCCTYVAGQAGDPCNSCDLKNRQWPGETYCGGSKSQCGECGATKWCKMVDKNKAALVLA